MSVGKLLDDYLELPPGERRHRFAETSRAARLAGVSQRTIQLWIESRLIEAVRIGHRYQVDLDSLKDYLRENAAR